MLKLVVILLSLSSQQEFWSSSLLENNPDDPKSQLTESGLLQSEKSWQWHTGTRKLSAFDFKQSQETVTGGWATVTWIGCGIPLALILSP